ncbi:SPFH domain-containing protein [Klebsiella variicola]|jgi:regulator of protease activity HflC (stomatin/prohibitin superfamily)|uniref:SPFH domain-containing protein n=1 Tax=Klebsiella variicola TaxID=244366 RepID=UPI002068F925|nr:MAG: SPFH domain / band 7 family protein [Bacteriophage sp.]DAE61123.1 MAG TPA: High frequency of lysogenization C protein [Caudoviricetes sp.]
MRKFIMGCILAVVAMTSLTGCYERVEPGNVGIIVNRLGDEKGVEQQVKGVGRYWIGWNEDLYTFPTFKQMKTYDGIFTFQMSDGTTIGYHIGVAYKVNPTKVATVFQTYRKGVDEITDSDLQQKIADSLNRLASRMTTDKFIDGGKSDLLTQALSMIQAEMTPVGIEVISLSYVGKPEYPPTVIASINAKVTANQVTLQREQEIKQSEAEAEKERAKARGESDSARIRAQGEADAIKLRGEALAANPNVIQLDAIAKWNGVMPTTMVPGASVPFVPVK